MRIGELALLFHRTDHSFETLAVRIDGGNRSLGYSADTGPGWSLSELGIGLDLVLCEATYTVEHEGTAGPHERTTGGRAGPEGERASVWSSPTGGRRSTRRRSSPKRRPRLAAPVEQAAIGKEFAL